MVKTFKDGDTIEAVRSLVYSYYSFLRAKSFQQLYNGKKSLNREKNLCFATDFSDASTHDRLFTYSEQNRPDKSRRVNVPLFFHNTSGHGTKCGLFI